MLGRFETRKLDRDLFDFVDRDAVAGAVVELGGPRAFVHGELLSLFERAAIFEVGGKGFALISRARRSPMAPSSPRSPIRKAHPGDQAADARLGQ
jgi:hypothetical protein